MTIRIKLVDLLLSIVLSVPIGGFIYGFLGSGLTFWNRIIWGIFGAIGFCSGLIAATNAMLSNWYIILHLFAGYSAALLAIVLARTLAFYIKNQGG